MALGDSNVVNKNNLFKPSIFGISFSNIDESAIMKSQLSITMWNKFLKISISSNYTVNFDNSLSWDKSSDASIYLNINYASMLMNLIDNFIDNPKKWSNFGVLSGKGLITLNCGLDFDKDESIYAIRIIQFTDYDRNKILRQSAYQFKDIYNYIYDIDGSDGSFKYSDEKCDNLELKTLYKQLEQYVNAMTYATAYSILDANSYNEQLSRATLKEIAHSVGTRVPNITGK